MSLDSVIGRQMEKGKSGGSQFLNKEKRLKYSFEMYVLL